MLFLVSCRTANVPEAYQFKVKDIQNNPYGSWVNITIAPIPDDNVGNSFCGELLCLDSDTLYLLSSHFLVKKVCIKEIVAAELFTHRNQSFTYGLMTALFLIPSIAGALINPEVGGYFLLFGVPAALIGSIVTVGENTKPHQNILQYPIRNSIQEFGKYSRFPQGKPENIDFTELMLKNK